MANKSDIVIECKKVRKTFILNKKRVDVIKDLDLTVSRGETVVIKGRSGSGKSTLMNLLSGIERVSDGEIGFGGISYSSLDNEGLAKHRQQNIGIIFQSFNLIPLWTAYENIEAALINTSMSMPERKKLIDGYLEELGIIKYKNHKPKELSVGQQQRVAVIRSLINEPQLLLGDEPIGDVDEETGEEIMKLITRIKEKNNITMIVTTHGEFPLRYGSRILAMQNGQLKEMKSR